MWCPGFGWQGSDVGEALRAALVREGALQEEGPREWGLVLWT